MLVSGRLPQAWARLAVIATTGSHTQHAQHQFSVDDHDGDSDCWQPRSVEQRNVALGHNRQPLQQYCGGSVHSLSHESLE